MILLLLKEWLLKRQSLFYIGRHDVLKAPLKGKEEKEALLKLQNGDEHAKDLLIEHNLRLVVYVAKKYDSMQNGNIEDLISIGTIGLVKAVNTFNMDKNIKLATYASRCIENEILMFLRKNNKLRQEISLDEPLNVDYDGNELLLSDLLGTDNDIINREIENEVEREQLLNCVNKLNEREKMIMEMRFGLNGREEKTQKEVADLIGISQSYISRLEKRIIKRLKTEFEKVM